MTTPDVRLAATVDGVHDLIRRRWSPRALSEQPVSREELLVLLDAARWAPSSFNEQPWRFLLTMRSGPGHDKLLDCLVPANQLWAGRAPVLMLMCARRTFSRNGAPNHYALHDTGLALGFLMLQATAMHLYVHAMAGFDRDKARVAFAIPDEYELGAAVAVGHLGDPANLSPKQEQAESAVRTRKSLREIVFEEAWGRPADP